MGELVAKLLAAGGAKLAITYNRGREEAESVSEEIRAGGGSCIPLQFDVQAPMPLGAVATGLSTLRHVYYFATPFITSGPRNSWDHSLFSQFCDYFVHGMVACVHTIADAHGVGLDKLRICQPSTSFLDVPSGDFAEYVASKAAAEAAGNALAARHPGLTYCCPRIPRILTDQTNAMIHVDTEDAVPHALRMLHAMHTSTEEVQHD
jgi:NAD(P)-dependent dehydrogenase (short-subunit alcohol dehydrogenase family)